MLILLLSPRTKCAERGHGRRADLPAAVRVSEAESPLQIKSRVKRKRQRRKEKAPVCSSRVRKPSDLPARFYGRGGGGGGNRLPTRSTPARILKRIFNDAGWSFKMLIKDAIVLLGDFKETKLASTLLDVTPVGGCWSAQKNAGAQKGGGIACVFFLKKIF